MNKKNPKIVFFGTPEFAAGILKSLIENKYGIAAAVTQPDKKIGRRQEIACSAVKNIALKNNIAVFQPESLRDSNLTEEIGNIKPDLFVVAAYGKILPVEILKIPKYGAVNVHASLLPEFRGASPAQCAILADEKETGITLIRMNEKMDEGDILAREKIEIEKDETANELLKRLEKLGAKMIVEFVPGWFDGKIKPVPQDHSQATYCKPIKREDGKINWNLTAREIYRKWRAYHPWPGIFASYKAKRLKLAEIKMIPDVETGEKPGKIVRYNQDIAVQSGKGLTVLKKIQLEGKKEMDAGEFAKGDQKFFENILT